MFHRHHELKGALARIAARTKPKAHKSPAQVRYEEERESKKRPEG